MNKHLIIILKDLLYKAKTNKNGNPFSALIFHNDGRYYWAVNEVLKNNDPTAHAEIIVLRKFGNQNPKGFTIISSGEPCPMCLTAIAWSGIKKVYYIEDYKVANKKFQFDQDSQRVNKLLKLGLKIRKIKL